MSFEDSNVPEPKPTTTPPTIHTTETPAPKPESTIANERGAIGWVLLWAVGIPIPVLLVLFLLRGCT